MKYIVFVTLCITGVVVCSLETKLPMFIPPCRAEDSECLKDTLLNFVPYLKNGIPECNFPPIEPLTFPDHNQSDISSSVMPYTISITKIQFTGASDLQVPKFTVDLEKLKLDITIFFPRLVLRSYQIVLVKGYGFDVDGEGLVTETYNNLTVSLSLKGERYASNILKLYLKWTEDLISVSLGQGVFEVDPSFTDRDAYQQFLNKASTEFADHFNPEIEIFVKNTIGHFILQSVNKLHEIFPITSLYD